MTLSKSAKLLTTFITFICFLNISTLTYANLFNAPHVPKSPNVNADSYILIDYDSGQIIAEHNADKIVEPASLTKMMSIYVADILLANGTLNMDDEVLVSEKAWQTQGSKMFIEVNTRVSVQDLFKGIIIQSGNDATIALAEHIAGSESAFSQMMNVEAQKLGMAQSNFLNSTGLPVDNHYTTARDMALLAAALIRDFPESYDMYAVRSFEYNDINQFNRNRLLWQDNSVDGIKTGHTNAAGYCLVASAMRDDMRLIAVVMGAENDTSRISATQTLLNYGFRYYETHKMYIKNETIKEERVWMGQESTIPLGLNEDLYITIPQGSLNQLNAQIIHPKTLKAPINKNTEIGELKISLNNINITERTLYSLNTVDKANAWGRLKDYMHLKVQSWFSSGSNAQN